MTVPIPSGLFTEIDIDESTVNRRDRQAEKEGKKEVFFSFKKDSFITELDELGRRMAALAAK